MCIIHSNNILDVAQYKVEEDRQFIKTFLSIQGAHTEVTLKVPNEL